LFDNVSILIICGSVAIVAVYGLRTLNVHRWAVRLHKEGEALRMELNRARRMLDDLEPEEVVSSGLQSAGLGQLLGSMDKGMVEKLISGYTGTQIAIPDSLWALGQGFLSKMKPAAGATDGKKEPSHPRQ
jgi:hypothetical protein